MPPQFEQNLAKHYVCYKKLNIPNFTYILFLKKIFTFIAILLTISILLYLILRSIGANTIKFYFILINVFLILSIMFIKKLFIYLIQLYQHYAPEKIRRKCLFMPTCSEYAILALEKYGIIVGLYKIYIRLFIKCKGFIYKIDYP